MALVICTVPPKCKSGYGSHFDHKYSCLQSWNKDSRLKQVAHPLFKRVL